jgi:hypothetical protein
VNGHSPDEKRSMNIKELRASLEARNELRRQSQLPLLHIAKELERHQEDERETAYWAFFDAHVEPTLGTWRS